MTRSDLDTYVESCACQTVGWIGQSRLGSQCVVFGVRGLGWYRRPSSPSLPWTSSSAALSSYLAFTYIADVEVAYGGTSHGAADGRAEDGAAAAHGAPEGALVVDRAKLGDDLKVSRTQARFSL